MTPEGGLLRITYVKSAIGYARNQKETVRSLGLRRLGDAVLQPDNAAVRGMVYTVTHLVAVEAVEAPQVVAGEEPAVPGRKER